MSGWCDRTREPSGQERERERTRRPTVWAGVWVLACAACAAAAETNLPAVSRPVAVVRVTLGPGEQRPVSAPLWPFGRDINEILGAQLSEASNGAAADVVLKWEAGSATPGYRRAVRENAAAVTNVFWMEEDSAGSIPSRMTLEPGEGWVLCNNHSYSQRVAICGEVAIEEEELPLAIHPGVTMVGYPYAAGAALPGLAPNDRVSAADGRRANGPLNVAEGYWVARRSGDPASVVRVPRPYADPFPAASDARLPRVESMTVGGDGRLAVTIAASGASGERLDLYAQDLSGTNAFRPLGPWCALAAGLPTEGRTRVLWREPAAPAPAAGDGIVVRCLIVARADADADGNGAPDAAEAFAVTGRAEALARGGGFEDGGGAGAWWPGSATNGISGGSPDGRPEPGAAGPAVIYVDRRLGRDQWTGRAPIAVGSDGPKRTIRAGLAEARAGDTLAIRAGGYGEDLNLAGRGLRVKLDGNVDLVRRWVADTSGLPAMTNAPGPAVTNRPPQP